MIRKIFTIFFILFLLNSCSWITNFYVLNSSNSPILVIFKHPKKTVSTTPYLERLKAENPSRYKKLKPTPCEIEKDIKIGKYPEICDEDLKNCRVLNPEEYKFDKDECSIELTLETNQAVELFRICCSYKGVKEEEEGDENIGKKADENTFTLTIKSPAGTTQYKGIELMRAFKKKEKTKYVLRYM